MNCETCGKETKSFLPLIKIGLNSKYGVVVWQDIILCNSCKNTKTINEICDILKSK